ncbi:hypothetical protein [Paenibacillus tianjinensis]|nr:hypothetical protein [Paenibacillus tianjinensis]
MSSGIKNTIPLHCDQINTWIECYKKNEMFVVNVGKEVFGLNPSLIADFRVHNEFSEQRNVISTIDQANFKLQNAYEDIQVLVKVDCKCGTVYTAETNKRKVWYCSKCKADIYLNDELMVETNKGKAYLMSNKLDNHKET